MKTVFPTFSQEGLTKLDFYTIMILQGLLSNSTIGPFVIGTGNKDNLKFSLASIALAKTLIEELEKEDDNTRNA